jgi:hypothetical protein
MGAAAFPEIPILSHASPMLQTGSFKLFHKQPCTLFAALTRNASVLLSIERVW